MNSTLAKVYGAIIGIPVAAIMLAGAIGGSSDSYDPEEYDIDLSELRETSRGSGGSGAQVSEAEAYGGLGKYNPCIFIACEGE